MFAHEVISEETGKDFVVHDFEELSIFLQRSWDFGNRFLVPNVEGMSLFIMSLCPFKSSTLNEDDQSLAFVKVFSENPRCNRKAGSQAFEDRLSQCQCYDSVEPHL